MAITRRKFIQSGAFAAAGLAVWNPDAEGTPDAVKRKFMKGNQANFKLRGFGEISVIPRRYSANHSSWITFTAQNPKCAERCGSKFMADLLGFGDIKLIPHSGLPGTTLALEDVAWWLVGRHGNACHILCARSMKDMALLARKANASAWVPIPAGVYPSWLDCMDNAALGFWFLGGGVLPMDVNADYDQFRKLGLTACVASGVEETRLIAPGVLDTSVLDWYRAMAKKEKVRYRMLLNWTQPMQPPMLWNRIPLPYVLPEAGAVPYADFQHESLQAFDAFVPVPASDPYTLDLRKLIASTAAEDPYFMAHHGSAELGSQTLVELSRYAGMPSAAEAWHRYLQHDLGLSLVQVGLRYNGNANAYPSWDAIPVPNMKDFTGWGEESLDLGGIWKGHGDPANIGDRDRWFADGAPADWVTIGSNDVILLEYSNNGESAPSYWIRRNVILSPEQCSRLKYLHISRAGWHALAPPLAAFVYLNGKLLKDETVDHPIWPDQDQCLDVADAAQPGDNQLVMKIHGPLSYVFLSAIGRWSYPSEYKRKNLLWYDATDFTCVYKLQTVENNLKAIRAGDPTRPIKIMAPWNVMDRLPELCRKYGAYPHDTGQGAACWGPWMPRYVSWMGIPTSSEPGGPAGTPQELRQFLTFFLMLGNSMADIVFDIDGYAGKPDMVKWMMENREMMRCIGKMDMPHPEIAVLRSLRAVRLNFQAPWSWDIARGEVQATGRTADYVDLPDFADGGASGFKVIFDDGTAVLTEGDVDSIEKYVRAGGIFVAMNLTGMHTPDTPYAWPISRLTGLEVKNRKAPFGNIVFTENQSLWPFLRGKEIKGDGMALDWLKANTAGPSLAQQAVNQNVKVIAVWADIPQNEGNIAVAARKLGKGMVVTLGSTFWRGALDKDGHWISRADLSSLLDEFFLALGVPRDSWVTGGQEVSQEIWAERWRSKNGVYDLYPTARINTNATQPPLAANIRLRTNHAITNVRDLAAQDHPVIPIISDSSTITLPQVQLEPMECHVYAAPRQDVEASALYWLDVQRMQWGVLPSVTENELPHVPREASDTLPLTDGWRMAIGQTGSGWTLSNYDDHTWKTVRLGSFAALGLDENAIAQFRRIITIPKSWRKQHVHLFFDASYWFWGFKESVRFWINGQEMPRDTIPTGNNGAFSMNVTKYTQNGKLTLALVVDGHLPEKQKPWRPRPAGVTGVFYLEATPLPVHEIPIKGWLAASEVGMLEPVVTKQTQKYKYLETNFTLPDVWPGKRLFLKSDRSLNWIILNSHVIAVPALFHTLDITRLALRKGENILRWIPDVDAVENPAGDHELSGTIPPLSLVWLP
jgi:hypothetical protein